MFSLNGKTAIVTGAAAGIGLAVCERFREAGAHVIGIDRIEAPGCEVADVSDEGSLAEAFEAVVRTTGRLDIVVNNAGIQPLGVDFTDLTPQLLQRTFAVNVQGTAFGIKHAARLMRNGGRIINTGSFVGTIGVPHGTAYAASKAAVVHLTRCAAVELASRVITVNCICPGTVATPAVLNIPNNPEITFAASRTPLGRIASPEEIAAAFHFLASDEAGYITGAILPVDGGISAGWERYDLALPPNIVDGQWTE
jgi:NAD(P)-dependent dehydrogenase (short-subunit alcohol dehydrogenase family)